jgi:hypothetical protein
MSKPLSRANLAYVYNEIDQISVAVSVVGTRRPMLMKLARMAAEVKDALVGSRPEVQKVRANLERLIHNARRAPTRARRASDALRKLAAGIKEAQGLVLRKGLGDPPALNGGAFTITNEWGYTDKEAKSFLKALRSAEDAVSKFGLGKALAYGTITLDPKMSSGRMLSYDPFSDAFYANPSINDGVQGVFMALAERLWVVHFKTKDVETWGTGSEGPTKFERAFARKLDGKGLDADSSARLRVTAGRIAVQSKWEKAAA